MLNKKAIVVVCFGMFVGSGALLHVAGCAGVSPLPAAPSSSQASGVAVVVAVGYPMPDIRVRELGAASDLSLRTLAGKVVLVDIWASWCAPCREELPMLDDLAARLRAMGVEVVAISIDEDEVAARAFLTMKSSWRLRVALDTEQRAQNALSPPKMPSSYVIDRSGVVRAIHAGFERSDVERLEAELLSLAGDPPVSGVGAPVATKSASSSEPAQP